LWCVVWVGVVGLGGGFGGSEFHDVQCKSRSRASRHKPLQHLKLSTQLLDSIQLNGFARIECRIEAVLPREPVLRFHDTSVAARRHFA
jgi:hypothetical protein